MVTLSRKTFQQNIESSIGRAIKVQLAPSRSLTTRYPYSYVQMEGLQICNNGRDVGAHDVATLYCVGLA